LPRGLSGRVEVKGKGGCPHAPAGLWRTWGGEAWGTIEADKRETDPTASGGPPRSAALGLPGKAEQGRGGSPLTHMKPCLKRAWDAKAWGTIAADVETDPTAVGGLSCLADWEREGGEQAVKMGE